MILRQNNDAIVSVKLMYHVFLECRIKESKSFSISFIFAGKRRSEIRRSYRKI